MCTVQGCVHVAVFFFTGRTDRGNSQTRVAAYCQRHAEETAARLGHPWPIPEPRPAEQIVRTRVLRAG